MDSPKQRKGRVKIPIRKIESKNKKHVTFSKRRKGLFKKATELCVLCGASVAIITFSEAGKVFAFGHPSTDAVVHRYLHGEDDNGNDRKLFWWDRPMEELGFEEPGTFAASLERMKRDVESRIADLDLEHYELKFNASLAETEFGSDHCPVPISIQAPMSDQMNAYYNNFGGERVGGVDDIGLLGFVSAPPPPGQNQYQYYGV